MSEKAEKNVILQVNHISKRCTSKGVCVRAVTDVSFDVRKGETIGIVGESGCGKTTLGRCIVRAISASEGEVKYKARDGVTYDFLKLDKKEMKKVTGNPVTFSFGLPRSGRGGSRWLLLGGCSGGRGCGRGRG